MAEKIKVKISKTGEIEYEVEGVKGKKCKDLTKAIDAISGKIISSEVTGEYCQTDPDERARYRNTGGED